MDALTFVEAGGRFSVPCISRIARPVGVCRSPGSGFEGSGSEGAAREWAGRWIGMEGMSGGCGIMTSCVRESGGICVVRD